MLKTIDYRSIRALQICIVFAATLAIQRILLYSHAGWIGFAVMMIYAGFDAGASIDRTLQRFSGMLLGLLLSYFIWMLGVMNYRVMIIIIPIVVFFAFFALGKSYAFPTIFTVTLTALGTDYYAPTHYDVSNFFFDYFRSTLVALCICIFFEGIVFKRKSVTHKFYQELQHLILLQLQQLLTLVSTEPHHQSRFLKLSVQFNVKILELRAFVQVARHDYRFQHIGFNELQEFNEMVEQAYLNIRRLFILAPQTDETLVFETTQCIHRLDVLSQAALQRGEAFV